MRIVELSEFQITTAAELIQTLRSHGQPPTVSGVAGENDAYIIMRSSALELFVYADGASVMGDRIDERFELPDYIDLDALRQSFISHVKKLIT